MKIKLVDDWKDFLKWYETWAAGVGIAGTFAWHQIPDEWRQLLMANKYATYAVAAVFALTMIGSVVAQPKLAGVTAKRDDNDVAH